MFMKTYEETTRSILERAEAITRENKRRNAVYKRVGVVSLCAVFVAAAAFAAVRFLGPPPDNIEPSAVSIGGSETSNAQHAQSTPEETQSAPYEPLSEPASAPAYESSPEESTPETSAPEESSKADELSEIDEESYPAEESYPVEESSAESGYVYENVKFLSADIFSSSRTAGEVSDEFKTQYDSFAAELLKKCFAGGNTLVSPLSAMTVLQMVANGARGATAEEMRKTLGGALSTEELNRELFNYYEELRSFNTDYSKLESANAVWMTDSEDFRVNSRFVDIIDDTFRAVLARAPFTEDSTVDAINYWCKKATDGMIPELLGYGDLDENTVMVLLNALTFDAVWSRRYKERDCETSVFHGEKGDTEVTMMYSAEYGCAEGEHETYFVKFYYDRRYAFAAILPEEGMSMGEYLSTFDGEKLWEILGNSSDTVMAGLPEFAFDWSGSLVDALKEMGIAQAFTENADFSDLGTLGINGSLMIDDVFQKTHIEVNPDGTRAAAASGASAVANSDCEESVVLDRPFVYMIIDVANQLPVFIGCVTDIG